MGRNKIVKDFSVKPKTVKWDNGAEKDEIESILLGLSEHIPAEFQGKLNKSILWAVRQLKEFYAAVSEEDMRVAETPITVDADEEQLLEEHYEEMISRCQPKYKPHIKRLVLRY